MHCAHLALTVFRYWLLCRGACIRVIVGRLMRNPEIMYRQLIAIGLIDEFTFGQSIMIAERKWEELVIEAIFKKGLTIDYPYFTFVQSNFDERFQNALARCKVKPKKQNRIGYRPICNLLVWRHSEPLCALW